MFDVDETTIAPCGHAPCTTLYCVIDWRMQIDAVCFAVSLSAKRLDVKVSYYRVQAGMNAKSILLLLSQDTLSPQDRLANRALCLLHHAPSTLQMQLMQPAPMNFWRQEKYASAHL